MSTELDALRARVQPVMAAARAYADTERLTGIEGLRAARDAWNTVECAAMLVAAQAQRDVLQRAYRSWRFDHEQAGGWRDDDMPPDIGLIDGMLAAAEALVAELEGETR